MKNLLAFLLIALSVPAFAQSQTISPPKQDSKSAFSLSIIGGLNFNKMPYRPNFSVRDHRINDIFSTETAYFLGLSGRQPLSRHLDVRLDAQYVVKGYRAHPKYKSNFRPEAFQVSYLEFSPQMEIKVNRWFHVALGGYFAVRMAEQVKLVDLNWIKVTSPFDAFTSKTEGGVLTGVRVQLSRVSIFAKYQYGLVAVEEIEQSHNGIQPVFVRRYHQSLQIGLGFMLL